MAAVPATIITPYSTLVVELGAILILALLLARVMRGYRPAEALATAGVGLLVILLGPAIWNAAAVNDQIRAALASGPGVRANEKCFTANGHGDLIPYARWLETRIPPHDDVAFSGPSVICMQLVLLPRRFVALSANPRWLILNRRLSAAERRTVRRTRTLPVDQRPIMVFAPGRALLRRR
jgi:hypothetical protein